MAAGRAAARRWQRPAQHPRSSSAADPARFERFSFRADNLLLDLSKTALDDRAMAALLGLARGPPMSRPGATPWPPASTSTPPKTGARCTWRCAPRPAPARASGGAAVAAEIHSTLSRMHAFTQAVHGGALRGATGQRFTHILNIGIGGSDLGPVMAVRALINPASPMTGAASGQCRWAWLARPAGHAGPGNCTMVLVASKTFTTQETMANARLVKGWLAETLGERPRRFAHGRAVHQHRRPAPNSAFPSERVFPFGDYVGGRFSMWSAIGLSLALALGWDSVRADAGRRPRDGPAFPQGAALGQPAGAAGADGGVARQRARAEPARGAAV